MSYRIPAETIAEEEIKFTVDFDKYNDLLPGELQDKSLSIIYNCSNIYFPYYDEYFLYEIEKEYNNYIYNYSFKKNNDRYTKHYNAFCSTYKEYKSNYTVNTIYSFELYKNLKKATLLSAADIAFIEAAHNYLKDYNSHLFKLKQIQKNNEQKIDENKSKPSFFKRIFNRK